MTSTQENLHQLLEYASMRKATDIHLTLIHDHLEIQFRIREQIVPLIQDLWDQSIFEYLKYIAGMDLTNPFIPQSGQFAWKLRQDERVVCMEKTNIRYVTPQDIDDALDFASVDVSFISLTKVLGPVRELLKEHGQMVCLIKPQFEAGREKVGKKGVVRDKAVHEEVIKKIIGFAMENGFSIHNLEYSPIKGPEGNIEYLVYIEKDDNPKKEESVDIHAVVEAAHSSLDK